MADKMITTLKKIYGRCNVQHRPWSILSQKNIFWHASFAIKQGVYGNTQNWQVWRPGITSRHTRSDHPNKISKYANWTSPLSSPRRSDQDSYMECLISTSDERDMASRRSICRAPWLDWVRRAVRPAYLANPS
jgi:hypothetical protein